MSHKFAQILLRSVSAETLLDKEQFINAQYGLEVWLIALFKSLQTYLLALLLGVFSETLIITLAYTLVRQSAGGWHAKKSINCSFWSLTVFVGLAFLVDRLMLTIPNIWFYTLAFICVLLIARYAPADTEKNPLVSVSQRKRRRRLAIWTAVSILTFAAFQPIIWLRTLVILGVLVEVVVIHPLTYQLLKRSYRNYENYVEQA